MAAGPPPFKPRPQKPFLFAPTDLERAYMAGLVDGEGCIRIYLISGENKKKGWSPHYGIALQVTNTKLDMLEWIAARFGGAIRSLRMRCKNRAGCHDWQAFCIDAFHVLCCIEPFLITKRRQALLAIAFQERVSGSTSAHLRLSGDELATRQAMYEEMKELNRRGAR